MRRIADFSNEVGLTWETLFTPEKIYRHFHNLDEAIKIKATGESQKVFEQYEFFRAGAYLLGGLAIGAAIYTVMPNFFNNPESFLAKGTSLGTGMNVAFAFTTSRLHRIRLSNLDRDGKIDALESAMRQ